MALRGTQLTAITAAIFMAVSVGAATGKRPAQKKTANKLRSSSSVATSSADSSATSGTGVSASAIAPAPQSQTAAAPDTTGAGVLTAAAPAPKSKFGAGFFTRHDYNAHSIYEKDLAATTLNRFSAKYMATDTIALSAAQDFTSNYATSKKEATYHTSDPFVQILNSKLAALPNDVTMVGFLRGYIPTGETTRYKTKRNSMFIAYAEFDKSFGKFDVDYNVLGVYVWNTQDYYMYGGEENANADYGYEHYLDFTYSVSSKFEITGYTGFDDYWTRSTPSQPAQRETGWNLETGARYRFTKQVAVYGSYVYRSALDSQNAVKFADDRNMTYRAMLSLSL